MDTEQPDSQDKIQKPATSRRLFRFFLQILLSIAACLLTLLILIRVFYPLPQMVDTYVSSGYTPTPLPPTNTRPPTQTYTPTPTQTATPTLTITPMPASANLVDLNSLNPDPPSYGISGVVLNDDTSVTVEPPFSNIQWSDSSTIAEQIGREITEPYHATFGAGSATWKMDLPLTTGYYEIFVLDTLYSSGGTLNFKVKLGNNELTPVVGSSKLEYRSSRGDPQQVMDLWRSIGIYNLTTQEILSIETEWDLRDEQTIVAIDRILILQLSFAEDEILSALPKGNAVYLVDDQSAVFEPDQYWEDRENTFSWGRDFKIVKNPPIEMNVTWVVEDPVPVTRYEIWAWIPEIHGTIETTYKLYAEGNEIALEDGSTSASITPGTNPNGAWVKIGVLRIPDHYGTQTTVTITMSTKGNTIGDVAADALALVVVP